MATIGSIRSYTRSINILRNAFQVPETDFEFLKDSQKVIDWIESSKYALNSRKAIYIAIISSLKSLDGFDLSLYRSKMDSYNKEIVAQYETQTLSKTEETKFMHWKDIKEAVEKARIAVEDVWTLQEYLILALYTMMPPVRLDYGDMTVIDYEPDEPVGNYLVLDKKPYFYFSDYKTFKVYGVIRIKICYDLFKVIKEWLPYTNQHLLIDRSGGPLGPVALGQLLIATFLKHSGRKIGVSILRHSYISYVRAKELPIKYSDALAHQMMHSPKMSMIYRKL